jgi:hypothetical protein
MKSILVVLITLISFQIQAQIIYTDVDPDVTVEEFLQGYGVDFNNDGKIDVHIALLNNTGVWVMHLIPDSAADNTFVIYDGEEASILELDDEIAPASNWYQLGEGWGGLLYGYWEESGEYGNWTGTQEDKYLGIKFEIGAEFHYGWIHLTTHQYSYTEMDFTIYDYAYNSTADELILAGDKGTGAGNVTHTLNLISVYPNPTAGILHYNNIPNLKHITVFDLNGKQHFCSIDKLGHLIDLSELNKGIYLLKFETKQGSIVKRIVKN